MAPRLVSALLLLLALPAPALAQGVEEPPPAAPELTVDLRTAAIVTGSELILVGASLALKDQLTPAQCRWCQPPQVDRWGRETLKWPDPAPAGTASDVLQLAIPAGALATLWIWAAPHGQRQVAEDLVVVTEAATTTMLLTQVAKFAAARLRPDAWAAQGAASPDDLMSFWSGHTSFAFATAAAATQVARLRGRAGWKWLAAITFTGAALTGYLRVAADRHWLTDVATGAAVGTAVGLVVPILVMRPADGRRPAAVLAPAPGGLALLF
jgi:hypothetical protein